MTVLTRSNLEWIREQYTSLLRESIELGIDSNVLFAFFGDFNQSKIDHILKLLETSVIESGDKRQLMKRFSGLLIEILQNISLHSARERSGHMQSYLIIVRSQDSYRILTGNLVMHDDLKNLDRRLTELNNMDKNALRKLYVETLCNDEFSYKGGAGLGLLTVAKRNDGPIRYRLDSLDENYGYFSLESTLHISED